MSLRDMLDLLAYWRENPPTHVILATRYLRREGSYSPRAAASRTEEEIEAEMGTAAAVLGPAQPMPGYARSALDWAEQFIAERKAS